MSGDEILRYPLADGVECAETKLRIAIALVGGKPEPFQEDGGMVRSSSSATWSKRCAALWISKQAWSSACLGSWDDRAVR